MGPLDMELQYARESSDMCPSVGAQGASGGMQVGKEIISFRGGFWFLSNMYLSVCVYEGDQYRSVEHAFQAAKVAPADRADFRVAALDAKAAKRLGRKKPLMHDVSWWNGCKLDVMETLVRSKFSGDASLAQRLVETAGRELIEGNTWGDTFWGMSNGTGENHLGKILMKVREELAQGR